MPILVERHKLKFHERKQLKTFKLMYVCQILFIFFYFHFSFKRLPTSEIILQQCTKTFSQLRAT